MIDGLTRDVYPEEIEEYRESGVVKLRGILSNEWVELLRKGLDEVFSAKQHSFPVFYNSTEIADQMKEQGIEVLEDDRTRAMPDRGEFKTIIGGWTLMRRSRRSHWTHP